MEKIKRKDGSIRYRESYYICNKKINGPYFTKAADAKLWKGRVETEKLSRLAQGEHYFEIQNVLFKDFAEKWLENYVKANCSTKTHQSYLSIYKKHLFPRFSKMHMREFTEDHGLLLMKDLKQSHNSKGILNIWQVIRSILIKARREKLILSDPFENIQRPKLDLRQDSFWIKDEITQFLKANHQDQLYPFFFVAIHTGMRLAELCGLCWDRVDFRLNQITISRTRDKNGHKDSTKTKLKRIVPMTQEVRMILLSIFEKKLNGKFIFVEKDGSEVKYAHIYRRFHFDLQKLLGHTKIEMTMRYAHFSPNHLQGSLRFMKMYEGECGVDKDFIPVLDLTENSGVENLRMLRN